MGYFLFFLVKHIQSPNSYSLFVSCANTANILWTGARGKKDGIPNAVLFQTDRNGYAGKVHADERAANVKSSLRADLFNRYGGIKIRPRGGGKGATCLGLRNDADLFQSVCLCACTLNDKSAIEMLAALCRKINALLFQNGINGFKNCFGGFDTRAVTDGLAYDLGG